MAFSNDHLADKSCCICENTLINTCKLPCRHEICFSCVQGMVKSEERSNNLSCPMCRDVFTVTMTPTGSLEQPAFVKEKYRKDIERSPDCGPLQHSSKVTGMAVLNDRLFVVCKTPPNIVFQYDIDSAKPFSKVPNKLIVEDMKWPRGLAANDGLDCLYITDWSQMFGGKLWRYDNRNASSKVAARLEVQPFGVSYSSRNDYILVTCATPINVLRKAGWIHIYRDFGSELIQQHVLGLNNLEIPRHAVLSSADKYLVCHGWNVAQHGVTAFQQSMTREVTIKSFYGSNLGGGSGKFEMKRPLSLAVDEDGLILVVDYYNHRIQLLTEDLLLLRHLITKQDHEVEYPRHVCLHPPTGRLFVGLENGQVLVFDARLTPVLQ